MGEPGLTVQIKAGNNVVFSGEELRFRTGGTGPSIQKSRGGGCSGASTISIGFQFYGGVNGDGRGDIDKPPCSGTASVLNYSFNTNSDTLLYRGKAGFIAVDPNTVPYSVS